MRRGHVAPTALVRRDATAIEGTTTAQFEAALGALWQELESPESRRGYQADWKKYCAWCEAANLDPRDATVGVVQRYVLQMRDSGCGKATRARSLSVLRSVYRALVVGGVCAANPAREVKNPRVDTTPQTPWLGEVDTARLFSPDAPTRRATHLPREWRDKRDHVVMLCLLLLGWRRSEVARIAVEHFIGDALKHTVKRGKVDTTGVPAYLLAAIKEWRAYARIEAGAILPRSPTDSRAISGKIVYDIAVAAAKRAGVVAPPHALRRTFITLLERRGVPLRDLQLAVSHDSVTTTERYQKASKAAAQAPGELLTDLLKKKEHIAESACRASSTSRQGHRNGDCECLADIPLRRHKEMCAGKGRGYNCGCGADEHNTRVGLLAAGKRVCWTGEDWVEDFSKPKESK